MSRNGSGTYTPPASSWSPAVNGATATFADWNALLTDLSAALTQSVSKDGQTAMTGNLPMGGFVLTGLGAGAATGQSVRWQQLFSQGTQIDLASATTTDIGAENTNFLNITGTTTITSFGTNYNGPRFLRFDGALTLTHNATTLILPGAANITTVAGDTCIAIPNASTSGTSDGWLVMAYQRAATTPQVPGAVLLSTVNASAAATVDFTSGITSTYKAYKIVGVDIAPSTDAVELGLRVSEDSGSTWKSSSGDYYHSGYSTTSGGLAGAFSGQTSTYIPLGGSYDNAASSSGLIEIVVQNPAGSTYRKNFKYEASHFRDGGNSSWTAGQGLYTGTAAINGLRLLMSSGNISGTFKLYGLQ